MWDLRGLERTAYDMMMLQGRAKEKAKQIAVSVCNK